MVQAQEGALPAAQPIVQVGGAGGAPRSRSIPGSADGQPGLQEEQLLVPLGQQAAQGGTVRRRRRQALGERLDEGPVLRQVGRSLLPLYSSKVPAGLALLAAPHTATSRSM